ncbi:hypothetical protein [Acinetobacter variabilis]|uniref:hypothetical protein n=1 Tax=Acinetobacter variabilis TaxID=70346 RepID=UPI00376FB1D8
MNDAVKYFQKNGLQRSKELVEMGFGFCSLEDGLSFHTEQLKRLVESHELVGSYGGLESSKLTVNYPNFLNDEDVKTTNHRLSKAIADVESCMEVNDAS